MIITAISDTHSNHRNVNVESADVLISCGDITYRGEQDVMIDFINWMGSLPHKHKIAIAGNHDMSSDPSKTSYINGFYEGLWKQNNIHYLFESSVEIEGFKFYGTPYVPNLSMWAFYDKNTNKFASVPDDTDVLVSHGPPYKIMDYSVGYEGIRSHYGSKHLLQRCSELKKLKAVVFGHTHHCYGQKDINGIKYVNAAVLNDDYKLVRGSNTFQI